MLLEVDSRIGAACKSITVRAWGRVGILIDGAGARKREGAVERCMGVTEAPLQTLLSSAFVVLAMWFSTSL